MKGWAGRGVGGLPVGVVLVVVLLLHTTSAQDGRPQLIMSPDQLLLRTMSNLGSTLNGGSRTSQVPTQHCNIPPDPPGRCGPVSQCPAYLTLMKEISEPSIQQFFVNRICRRTQDFVHFCCPVDQAPTTANDDPSEHSSFQLLQGTSQTQVGQDQQQQRGKPTNTQAFPAPQRPNSRQPTVVSTTPKKQLLGFPGRPVQPNGEQSSSNIPFPPSPSAGSSQPAHRPQISSSVPGQSSSTTRIRPPQSGNPGQGSSVPFPPPNLPRPPSSNFPARLPSTGTVVQPPPNLPRPPPLEFPAGGALQPSDPAQPASRLPLPPSLSDSVQPPPLPGAGAGGGGGGTPVAVGGGGSVPDSSVPAEDAGSSTIRDREQLPQSSQQEEEIQVPSSSAIPPEELCGTLKIIPKSAAAGQRETWPWVAALGQVLQGSNKFVLTCAGTLVTRRHVLAPAHCLSHSPPPSHVRLGEFDFSRTNDLASPVDVPILSFIDPGYNSTTKENDLAIVTLARNVTLTDFIQPACLPFRFKYDGFRYQDVTVVGWAPIAAQGVSLHGAVQQQEAGALQGVQVRVVGSSQCRATYGDTIVVDRRQLCGATDSQTSCLVSKGSPAFYLDDVTTDRYFLVGVESHQTGCSQPHSPRLYTRLGAFLPWLIHNL